MANFPPPPPDGSGWGPPTGGMPGYGQDPDLAVAYASWGQRVGASLIDALPALAISFITRKSGFFPTLIGFLAALGFGFWNLARQGRTGQTIGKGALGIRLAVIGHDGPPGVGLSIGRSFVHILDALPLYLGFLWPLWDERRQTFADKILNTVVLRA